ncbi:MAG TPA: (2Fe-2S)-binding protein [Xanthobacteraceae bacterium]|nr:(2Fe-2S)-binding protein [Xanthobacteraceae bacterium]
MIVCSCNVISDHDVEAVFAAADTPQTVSQVYRRLGHRANCGRCAPTIRDILKDDRGHIRG